VACERRPAGNGEILLPGHLQRKRSAPLGRRAS
jgi:hypothetical protein